jgi:hypothetical protein
MLLYCDLHLSQYLIRRIATHLATLLQCPITSILPYIPIDVSKWGKILPSDGDIIEAFLLVPQSRQDLGHPAIFVKVFHLFKF